jgi:hypothetical protein
MIIGKNTFNIDDFVTIKGDFKFTRGVIVDVRVKKKRGQRLIQYKVKFKCYENKYRIRAEWWYNESDILMWDNSYSIIKRVKKFFNVG